MLPRRRSMHEVERQLLLEAINDTKRWKTDLSWVSVLQKHHVRCQPMHPMAPPASKRRLRLTRHVTAIDHAAAAASAAPGAAAPTSYPLGKQDVPLDDKVFGLMESSNHLLNDGAALAAELKAKGYLYLKQMIPKPAVEQARARVERGVLEAAGATDASLGHYFLGHTHWHSDAAVAPCVEHEALHGVFDTLFDRPSSTLDYKWVRGSPGGGWSGFHCDSICKQHQISRRALPPHR